MLFGLAVAVAAFLASLFAFWAAKRAGSALARRARRLALAAGTLVTLLCLVYLTLWWRIANARRRLVGAHPGRPSRCSSRRLSASLLGHAVTVAAMAVALAATGAPVATGGVTSWWMTIASVLVAVGGAALLLLVCLADSIVGPLNARH